jgi:hypothetical protein
MSDTEILNNDESVNESADMEEHIETSGDAENETSSDADVIDTESNDEQATDDAANEPSEEVRLAAQKLAGSAIAKERAKLKAKYEAQLKAQQNYANQPLVAAPEGTIFDEVTGEYTDINSVAGQMALREQKAKANKEREKQATFQAQRQEEQAVLIDKVNEGFDKFDNYDQSLQTFLNLGTEAMAEALKGSDHPDAIIDYLAQKQGELKRIASLPLGRQLREIVLLENLVTTKRNLVTKAKAAPTTVKNNRTLAVSPEHMSAAQLDEYYHKKYNTR